jgi:sugar phosphate isomerase/epimerase
MKLAVSNIAWPVESDAEAFDLLAANGIRGIEIAPTRIWPQWQGIDAASVAGLRSTLDSAGLTVSSLQAILFQKPELHLFGSDRDRQAMFDHLCRCADLAGTLGAYCLVFGAPKNRDRGALSEEDAFPIACDFFAKVGDVYAARHLCIGFEANPPEYGCNFATESRTAARLVRAVDSAGFRLHLDTACLYLAGESPRQAIEQNSDILRHFHVSEPNLGPFSAPKAPHKTAAQALRNVHYDGWAALEMRAAGPPLPALTEAVRYIRETYGDGS